MAINLAVAVPAGASASIPDDVVLQRVIYHQVGRLRVLTELHVDALLHEFYFHSSIVMEWAETMLPQLLEAAFPLSQYLEGKVDQGSSGVLRGSAQRWLFYDRTVTSAIEDLLQEMRAVGQDQNPVRAIYRALRHINRAYYHLKFWQEDLRQAGITSAEPPWNYPLVRKEWDQALTQGLEEFRQAIDQRDSLRTCRLSRLLFLMGFTGQTLYPEVWAGRRALAIDLHAQAVARLEPGTEYYANTHKRWLKLQELTPEKFEEFADDYTKKAAA